jgi:diguanylate cyclase (GGDEF)-like protein/PAS domain S-box-containing protein
VKKLVNIPFKLRRKIELKIWVLLLVIYLFPPIFDFLDSNHQYLDKDFWLLYLLPTVIFVYLKGYKVGILKKKNYKKQLELRKTKDLFESIFNNLDIAIWSIDKDKNMLLSKGVEYIYGQSRDKGLSNSDFWRNSIHPEDFSVVDEIDAKWDNIEGYEYEYRITRPNGEIRWIRDRGLPVINDDGFLERFDGSNIDITRQKKLEFDLKESEERYKILVENALVGVYLIQNFQVVYVNQWFSRILGIGKEELLGTNFIEYIKDDKKRLLIQFRDLIEGKVSFVIDKIQTKALDGSTKYLEVQANLTSINGEVAIIGIALDVTDRKKAQAELQYRANYDVLTGLPNMIYLNTYIKEKFQALKKEGLPITLMFFDLDRFKLINDSFGHRVGDQLLKIISNRLVDSIQDVGEVIRAGGDEFILYLPYTNKSQAMDLANYLLKYFSEPLILEEQEIRIAASIGVAFLEMHDSLDDLFQKASSALHVAKEYGRNQYQIYTTEFSQKSNRRLQLEQRLRKAMEKNELEVFYQPKINLYTNKVTGLEALARWTDPLLGAVSPAEFIPLAEETGIIISIGKWVLETVCKQNSEWQKKGLPPVHVCVNISSRQFLQDDFVKMVEQVLNESNLSPAYLNIEITEGVALYNVEDAIEKLMQLKQLGVSISLDDFGTGYSSLSYLKSLPIDYLKIDRSFINGIFNNKQDAAIIHSIISLSHTLGLRVVAEGVEEKNQIEILEQLNCDEIQGYYYAKPMSKINIEEFMSAFTFV